MWRHWRGEEVNQGQSSHRDRVARVVVFSGGSSVSAEVLPETSKKCSNQGFPVVELLFLWKCSYFNSDLTTLPLDNRVEIYKERGSPHRCPRPTPYCFQE